MKKEYKIFEGGTIKEMLTRCLKEGYKPQSIKDVWTARDKKQIPDKWYDTSTVFIKGVVRQATIKELRNIDKFYASGGRLLVVGGDDYNDLDGSDVLYVSGRFRGVKNKK